MRLVRKHAEVSQEWVYPGQRPVGREDLRVLHEADPLFRQGFREVAWPHRLLVDDSVFCVDGPRAPRQRGVLIACGWDNPELLPAVNYALNGMVGCTYLTGQAGPEQMAELYRSHAVVLSLRPGRGPSFTIVEAALCGAIPVVSDCPEMREHFADGGARFCELYPDSILAAVAEVRQLAPDARAREVARNLAYFAEWTESARGAQLVKEVLATCST